MTNKMLICLLISFTFLHAQSDQKLSYLGDLKLENGDTMSFEKTWVRQTDPSGVQVQAGQPVGHQQDVAQQED